MSHLTPQKPVARTSGKLDREGLNMDQDRQPCLVSARITQAGTQWVIVPHTAAEVAVVNQTGHAIAQRCDGRNSVRAIAQAIAADTSVDPVAARNDVDAFLDQLDRAGLLMSSHDCECSDRDG